jgi:hypothetical protein
MLMMMMMMIIGDIILELDELIDRSDFLFFLLFFSMAFRLNTPPKKTWSG